MAFSKKKKVELVLIQCPPWDTEMPPLGLAYLTTFLKSKGVNLKTYDLNIDLFHKVSQEYKKWWEVTYIHEWQHKDLHHKIIQQQKDYLNDFVKKILGLNPKFVCFSITYANKLFVYDMLRTFKKTKKDIIFGLGGPSVSDNDLIREEISRLYDFTIEGEAEYPLLNIVINSRQGKPFGEAGDTLDNGKFVFKNKQRVDVSELPFPTYKEFSLHKYSKRTLPFSGSRGCFGKCHFCIDWVDNSLKVRSGKQMFEELSFHIKHNKIYQFRFTDLIINGNIKELERFCDEIIKHNLQVIWWSMAVVNLGLSKKMTLKMQRAGCRYLEFGVESFSPSVLKLMNKPFKYDHILPVLKNTKEAGIRVGVNILVGFPGETLENFEENLDNLKKHRKYIDSVPNLNPVYVYGNAKINVQKELFSVSGSGVTWKTIDEQNTYAMRVERYAKVRSLLRELKIPFHSLHNSEVNRDAKKYDTVMDSKDIMLINAPPHHLEPPQSLLRISDFLSKKGVKTDVFDLNIFLYQCHNSIPEIKYLWKNFEQWKSKPTLKQILNNTEIFFDYAVDFINQSTVPYVFVPINSLNEKFVTHLLENLSTNKKILLFFEEEDIIVNKLMLEKCTIIQGPDVQHKLLNLMGKKPGESNHYKYDNMPLMLYKKIPFTTRNEHSNLPYYFSEGESYKNPQKIFSEIEWSVKKYHIPSIVVEDGSFGGNLSHLETLCTYIKQNKTPVQWTIELMNIVPVNLLKALHSANCMEIDLYRWSTEIRQFLIQANLHNIKVNINIVPELLGSTNKEIFTNLDTLKNCDSMISKIKIVELKPFTEKNIYNKNIHKIIYYKMRRHNFVIFFEKVYRTKQELNTIHNYHKLKKYALLSKHKILDNFRNESNVSYQVKRVRRYLQAKYRNTFFNYQSTTHS